MKEHAGENKGQYLEGHIPWNARKVKVDFARMTLDPAEDGAVDAVDPEADRGKGGEEKT